MRRRRLTQLYCSYTLARIALIRQASSLLGSDGRAWRRIGTCSRHHQLAMGAVCFTTALAEMESAGKVLVGVLRPLDKGEGADGTKTDFWKKIQD